MSSSFINLRHSLWSLLWQTSCFCSQCFSNFSVHLNDCSKMQILICFISKDLPGEADAADPRELGDCPQTSLIQPHTWVKWGFAFSSSRNEFSIGDNHLQKRRDDFLLSRVTWSLPGKITLNNITLTLEMLFLSMLPGDCWERGYGHRRDV